MYETAREPILSNTMLSEIEPHLCEPGWRVKVNVLDGVVYFFIILSKQNNQKFVAENQT